MSKRNFVPGWLVLALALASLSAHAALGIKAIATCGSDSFAVASDGTVWEWGWDGFSQQPGAPAPAPVAGLSSIVAVAGNTQGWKLALKEDGTLWAWGYGRNAPERLQVGLDGVMAIAMGSLHVLALKTDGTVWAWGHNYFGQLGDGTRMFSWTAAVQVSGLTGVKAIAAGDSFSLAMKSDGTIWAWGDNSLGQLGDEAATWQLTPVPVNGITRVAAIAASGSHSLALKDDGTVWEWGAGLLDPLSGRDARFLSDQVSGLTDVIAIASGGTHNLALREDGSVWAWGQNDRGQLGDGTTTSRSTPVPVTGLTGVAAIAAGAINGLAARDDCGWFAGIHALGCQDRASNSLVLKNDGTIWAWGDNYWGQLGDGTMRYETAPVAVAGLTGVTAAVGGGWHTLALKNDGTVWAWGLNNSGQLGDGSTTSQPTPVKVSGLDRVTAVAAGASRSLALRNDGTVWWWGRNDGTVWSGGQSGTFTDHLTPVAVSGLADVVAIAAGGFHNLALKKDGTVWAWGANWNGQLGDGTTWPPARATPAQVPGLSGVVAIAADPDHSLALTRDGTVWTWGRIGWIDGTWQNQLTPAQVAGLRDAAAAAWASGDGLAVKTDGTVWEWGIPERGIQSTPAQVKGLDGVIAVAGGNATGYFCGNCGQRLALKSDRTVWAWGDDDDGQLGDGTTTAWPGRMTPAPVRGLAGVAAIGAGQLHSLAVTSDGAVWAWGSNVWGQLGIGRTAYRTTPVQVIAPRKN